VTPASVSSHVSKATAALQDFRAAVRSGNDAAARGALKRNRRQTSAAASEAAAVTSSAAPKAVSKVGRLQARNIGSYIGAFPFAPAELQLDLTGLIGVAAGACDIAASTLEQIADYSPEAARDHILAAADSVRQACDAALPEVPGGEEEATDMLNGLLEQCHSAVQRWTGFVGGLLDKITAILPVQIPVFGDMLDSMLGIADKACDLIGGIGPIADRTGAGLLGGLFDGILGGGSSGSGSFGFLGGMLDGLFGNLFGGAGASGARN
jgi:hypothetical protein